MFANALFIVAIITLAATSILSEGIAMTRAGEHRIAQQYLSVGYERAATATRNALADALRTGQTDPGTLSPLPTISPLPSQCANGPSASCQFSTDATVALAPATSQSANLQSNAAVREGRVVATIAVDVTALDGTRLVTRTQTVMLRTFAVPPYVTIAGAHDTALDNVSGAVAQGDDGGLPPLTSLSTCPSPAPSATPSAVPDETVVRVQYHDDRNGGCMDGSVWQQRPLSANASPAASGWSP
jgi:hypothetical protein